MSAAEPENQTQWLTGLPGGSKSYYVLSLARCQGKSIALITAEDLEGEGLSADLEAWCSLLPPEERLPIIYFPEFDEAMSIAALGAWSATKKAILVCSKGALEKPVYSPAELKSKSFELRPGQEYPREKLLSNLAQGGYSRTDMVEL